MVHNWIKLLCDQLNKAGGSLSTTATTEHLLRCIILCLKVAKQAAVYNTTYYFKVNMANV